MVAGVTVTEIDNSRTYINSTCSVAVLLGPTRTGKSCLPLGMRKPVFIGKFPLKRYYNMSRKRKLELLREFRSGEYQRKQFVKIFGTPGPFKDATQEPITVSTEAVDAFFSQGALAEMTAASNVYVVRANNEDCK